MSGLTNEELLARLAGGDVSADGDNPWHSVAASHPEHDARGQAAGDSEQSLESLVSRIRGLTAASKPQHHAATRPPVGASAPARSEDLKHGFFPEEPPTFHAAGLTDSEVEALILKYLLGRGDAAGRDVADQLKLPFVLIDESLRQLKNDQLIAYKGSAMMNDYVCTLSDLGRERARRLAEHCTYFGAAPVSLEDYIASVKAQSLDRQHPCEERLKHAFEDLLINPKMLSRLGPAINSGRGMFLYGYPGNGKTSIAERVTRAFGRYIWIPRAISIDGEIMRVFDPMNHVEAPSEKNAGLLDQSKVDKRWVRVERPTIVAGGELTMENLEVAFNTSTGICEAPLQLKSNCGTLVIDDFGRQRISIDELLNRWIVPLETRYDYLNFPNGKKIRVPFDQLIVFSTNLEPKDLVDEAFLRRIAYKIEVVDPNENEFRQLFRIMCPKTGFQYDESVITYLIETHYKQPGRSFRCCHPRDLLMQVRNHCLYQKSPLVLSNEAFDFAAENYFAVM